LALNCGRPKLSCASSEPSPVRRVASPPLAEVRAYAKRQLAALPDALRDLEVVAAYPVEVAEPLHELARQVDARKH